MSYNAIKYPSWDIKVSVKTVDYEVWKYGWITFIIAKWNIKDPYILTKKEWILLKLKKLIKNLWTALK